MTERTIEKRANNAAEERFLEKDEVKNTTLDENCRIDFDFADQIRRLQPIIRLPEEMQRQVIETSTAMANDLYREGGRGPAAVRLMAKDIALLRIDVSQADALVALMREKLKLDPEFSPRRLEAAVKSSEIAHRNLQNALRHFARITEPTIPTLHMRGHQNYVHIGERESK